MVINVSQHLCAQQHQHGAQLLAFSLQVGRHDGVHQFIVASEDLVDHCVQSIKLIAYELFYFLEFFHFNL